MAWQLRGVREGCSAVAPSQRLHGPVRGRLRRLAYRCDRSYVNPGPPATARNQQLAVPARAARLLLRVIHTRWGKGTAPAGERLPAGGRG